MKTERTHAVQASPNTLSDYGAAEWQARIDLAAAHRLAYLHGFSEGIFNLLTFVVPDSTDRYYSPQTLSRR